MARAALLAAVLVAAAIAAAGLVMRPGDVAPTAPLARVTPEGIAAEDVTVESDGLSLAATLYRPADPRVLVMILPRPGAGREDPWTGQILRPLVEGGAAVLTFDTRGTGASEGEIGPAAPRAQARDARAVARRGREMLGDLPLAILALGPGGRAAALAALSLDPPPVRLLAVSTSLEAAPALLLREERQALDRAGVPAALAERVAPLLAWYRREVREPLLWAATGDFDPAESWSGLPFSAHLILGEDDPATPALTAAARAAGVETVVLRGLDGRLAAPGGDRIAARGVRAVTGFLLAD